MFIVASGNSNTNSWEVSTLCSAEGTPSARAVGIAGSLGVTHAAADCTSSNSGWETELMWGFCTGVFAELPLKSPQKPQEYPRRKERLNGKAVLAPTLPKEAVLLWRRALPCLPLNPFVHHLPYVMCSAAHWFLERIRYHSDLSCVFLWISTGGKILFCLYCMGGTSVVTAWSTTTELSAKCLTALT